MSTDVEALRERFFLKAFVESCLVLEEGVCTLREIDLGLAAGARITPPPFARADQLGLNVLLERLERAAREWGQDFTPPTILRRLVAQGRLGVESGQGFFAYPRPDVGFQEGPVKLERRGEIAIVWLDRPPANSISPDVVIALRRAWDAVVQGSRGLVLASANPALFCAGADIRAFATMDAAAAQRLAADMHELTGEMETSRVPTIAAVNGLALGGGCELAMACDVRLAAESASFGQPEINLGIIPGFGGTQRLPGLVGRGKALEMSLTGEAISSEEAYERGLATRVVPDEELFDAAIAWARRLAAQPPVAIEQLKTVFARGDVEAERRAFETERRAFARTFDSEDAGEGISAFLRRRPARFQGR